MSNDTRPEIRFPEFTDEWEQRKLINYTKLITKGTTPKDKTGSGKVNFVKVENLSDGKILPIQKITEEEHEGYLKRSRLEEGDILFSIAGTLGRTAIVNKSILPANTNQALAIIRSYDFDKYFLVTTLTGHVVAEYIRKNPTVGAQPNLSLEQVGQLIINTPIKGEQIKIGTFFKQLDDTIALHQRKLDLLKETKKGFLQKMFPKNGAKVPEIRFSGFTEDWEQRKLGDITESFSGGTPTAGKSEYYGGDIPFIRSGEISSELTELFITENGLNNSSAKMVKAGDILYALYGATSGEVSISRINGAINQAILAIRPTKNDNSYLIVQWLRKQKDTIISTYLQGGQGNLSGSIVKDLVITLPQDKEEQNKIGAFFKQLDDTIALHQRKLDLLKETKKGFLQKMFV
ncbi:TPA: restriction endonuclease subunit S [Enterococcus faecium]